MSTAPDAYPPRQLAMAFAEGAHPRSLAPGHVPFYTTAYGAAYLADARTILAAMPDRSVNLVLTSPPYALHFQKEYGNVPKAD